MSWLRMHPFAYFLLAPLIFAFGVYMLVTEQQKEAAKAAALAGKAPAAVVIEQFDRTRNVGPANEVHIVGQVDLSRMMELTETKRGVERGRWNVAPIYAVGAKDNTGPVLGVFDQHGSISDAQLSSMIIRNGAFAPIMKINGQITTEFKDIRAVEKALKDPKLADNALIVDPFEDGRAAGLAASGEGQTIALVIMGLAVAVLGYGWFLFVRRRRQKEQEAKFATAA